VCPFCESVSDCRSFGFGRESRFFGANVRQPTAFAATSWSDVSEVRQMSLAPHIKIDCITFFCAYPSMSKKLNSTLCIVTGVPVSGSAKANSIPSEVADFWKIFLISPPRPFCICLFLIGC
jgi:hypothetical protein